MILLSTDDILHARIQTMGIAEHTFEVKVDGKTATWHLYDVGGTRGQRHTWAVSSIYSNPGCIVLLILILFYILSLISILQMHLYLWHPSAHSIRYIYSHILVYLYIDTILSSFLKKTQRLTESTTHSSYSRKYAQIHCLRGSISFCS